MVTEPFNYKARPEILAGFVWRFSEATDEQRGFDPSAVTVDSETERQRFIDTTEKHAKEQLSGLSAEEVEKEMERHFWPGLLRA